MQNQFFQIFSSDRAQRGLVPTHLQPSLFPSFLFSFTLAYFKLPEIYASSHHTRFTHMFPLTLFRSPSISELINLQILPLSTTSKAKEILLIYALGACNTLETLYFF